MNVIGKSSVVNSNHCQPEEKANLPAREIAVAWAPDAPFTMTFTRRAVGPRLLVWQQNDTAWVSAMVGSRRNGSSWTASLNCTAEAKQ